MRIEGKINVPTAPIDPSTYPYELASILSDKLRVAKQELVTQWLNRITERVTISTGKVFPTHDLLNHVPLLIEGIAGFLKRPERDIDSKAPVVAKEEPKYKVHTLHIVNGDQVKQVDYNLDDKQRVVVSEVKRTELRQD